MILKVVSILFVAGLAFAGKQNSYPISVKSMALKDTGRIVVSGTYNGGTEVTNIWTSSIGVSSDRLCGNGSCVITKLKINNSDLWARVSIDADNDGNIEKQIDLKIGAANSLGHIKLSSELLPQVMLVEERYSVLEKLAGARDKDFLSIKINIE